MGKFSTPEVPPEWGAMLFKDDFDSKKIFVRMLLVSLVLLAAGVAIFTATSHGTGPIPCVGLFLVGVGVLFGASAFYMRTKEDSLMYLHERGLARVTASGTLLLPYEDVRGFACTLEVGNGLAIFETTFYTESGPKIEWRGSGGEKDSPKFRHMRDLISQAMAKRVVKTLQAGGKVALTTHIQLERDGIRLVDQGVLVKYADLDAPLFDSPVVAGKLELTTRGSKVLSITPEDRNYWPARVLLDDNVGLLRRIAKH